MPKDGTGTGPSSPEAPVPAGHSGPAIATIQSFYLHRGPFVALAFGATLQIRQYAFRRSLWLDEAALAISVVNRSYAGLLRLLDGNQIAPVGFLWIQRSFVTLFGNNEYALRIFPLLAGLASLVLFYLLVRRLLSPWVVPIATGLFAVSPFLIYYSQEAKQYAGDVFATLVVLNVGYGLLRAPRIRTRSLVGFALLGATLVWISYPVVFVLAGVGGVVVASHLAARRWRNAAGLAAACSAWTVSLVALWTLTHRYIDSNPGTVDYWRAGFPPEGGSVGEAAGWLGERAVELMRNPIGLSFTGLGLFLCGLGAAALVRRRRGLEVLALASTIAFAVLGSALHIYPIRMRLLLFLVPLVVLLLASAIDWPSRSRTWLRFAGAALLVPLAVVAASPARSSWNAFVQPPGKTEARPVFEHVAARWRPGDALYMHAAGDAAYRYYGPILHLEASGRLFPSSDDRCDPALQLSAFREAKRVWVVFAHRVSSSPANENEIIRSFVEVVARPISSFAAHGSEAYLYDTQGVPADPDGKHVIVHPTVRCISLRLDGPRG